MNKIDKIILEELLPVLLSNKTISFESDFCNDIGLLKQNIQRIKKGLAHFTPGHINNICRTYKVNANWIFSIEKSMFLKSANQPQKIKKETEKSPILLGFLN